MHARRFSETLQIQTSPIKNDQLKHLPQQTRKTQNQTQPHKRNNMCKYCKKSTHISDSLVFQLGDFWPFGTSPPRGRPFETLRKGEPPLQDTARKELQGTSMDISGHKGYYRCLRDFSILSLLLSHRSLILWNLGTIFLKKKGGKLATAVVFGFFSWGRELKSNGPPISVLRAKVTHLPCLCKFPISNQKAVGLSQK